MKAIWQAHNERTSRFNRKRQFLTRKLTHAQHGRRDPRDPFKHERMAALYRQELARLGAQA